MSELKKTGSHQKLRDCLFQFREFMTKRIIWPVRFSNIEIKIIKERLLPSENWSDADAFNLYKVLSRYRREIMNAGFNFNSVPIPRISIEEKEEETEIKSTARRVESVTISDNKICIYVNYGNNGAISDLKHITGRKYNPDKYQWEIPVSEADSVLKLAKKYNLLIGESAKKYIEDYENNFIQSYSAERVELGLKLKKNLYDFQTVGTEFGIRVKRSLLADQMGLGKTPQAIATSLGINDYPVLIICPKSLRNNWANEIQAWTDKKSIIIDKKNFKKLNSFIEHKMFDYYIVNYDGIKTFFVEHINEVLDKNNRKRKYVHLNGTQNLFKGVIIDEAHELCNVRTLRFKVINKVIKGYKYKQLLTGTPVVNTVKDLAAQLQLLEVIDEFGGYRKFVKSYSKVKENSFDISDNYRKSLPLKDLNVKLRSMCMIRREKYQVLTQLPDKIRTIIPLELDNRKDYDEAYINLQQYMTNQGFSTEAISNAARAEILVRIQMLKKIAVRGKIKQFVSFVSNLILQREKVIVFCWHLETIEKLKEHFPDLLEISGNVNDNEVEFNKKLFMESPDHRLIVITYKRGGVGHTLTSSSNVLFIEFGWNHKDMDQAEDRAHRIGQKDNVNCYYFLGKDTIDEWNYDLINGKRSISKESLGGTEEVSTSVQSDLMKKIYEKN